MQILSFTRSLIGVVVPVLAIGMELVEAAGVEPASEKVRRAKPTCVSGSGVSVAT